MDGQSIKRLRQMLGISQIGFAKAIGVSQPFLSYMEKDRRPIPPDKIKKIKSIYGVSIRAQINRLEQEIAMLKMIK